MEQSSQKSWWQHQPVEPRPSCWAATGRRRRLRRRWRRLWSGIGIREIEMSQWFIGFSNCCLFNAYFYIKVNFFTILWILCLTKTNGSQHELRIFKEWPEVNPWNFFLRKADNFFCYHAWPSNCMFIIFVCYKKLKLNSKNRKTKKNKDR